jgi:hypothetical protein
MSFFLRSPSTTHSHAHSHKSSTSRKIINTFLILLTLFLIGTVIVLSSVSYWLAIPSLAYLTEDEVGWSDRDMIGSLKYDPGSALSHRIKRDEGDVADGILGVESLPKIWEEMEEDLKGDQMEEPGLPEGAEAIEFQDEEQVVWGVDGKGSGGYWMLEDWDGHVEGTHSWERLSNVTTRYVLNEGVGRIG